MDRYYSSDEDREERREACSSRRKEERSERRSEKRKSHRRDRSKDRHSRYERSRSRSHGRRSRSRSRSRRSRSPRYSRHHESKSKPAKDTDKGATSVEAILNPVILNAGRYAEQIAKRKQLWNSRKPDAAEQEVKNTAIWQSAKFSQDQDGKMTAKFQRLMGIKDNVPKPQDGNVKDMFKKQEELFSTMEMQYEVARATTHTQRGVGLGFGPRHIP